MLKHLWMVLALFSLTACGGSGGGSSDAPASPYTGTLSGTLVAPNGTTPIPDATLFIEDSDGALRVMARSADTRDCPAPATTHDWTCSDADGTFSFDVEDLQPGSLLHASKGAWSLTYTLQLRGNNPGQLGTVAFDSDAASGAARIAVVTGSYDRIQDLLAKMGMGELGEGTAPFNAPQSSALAAASRHVHGPHSPTHHQATSSHALPQTLNAMASGDPEACFELQDPQAFCDCMEEALGFPFCGDVPPGGGLILGTETFDLYDGDNSLFGQDYPSVSALFEMHEGQPRIFSYDIVYVNCGAIAPGPNEQTILAQYVAEGGVLYATDLASDWVAAIPGKVEPVQGTGLDMTGNTLPATVVDAPLASWLANVNCIDGACVDDTGIDLIGFASGWHLLTPEGDSNPTILTRADVSQAGFPGETDAALTFLLSHGEGQIIYSSYHTAEGTALDGYLPQERILEYLFFSQTP